MNLRPSGYEPDELPGCSTPRQYVVLRPVGLSTDFGDGIDPDLAFAAWPHGRRYVRVGCFHRLERYLFKLFIRFGGDLLSHVLRRSTIGAIVLNGRVREGIGCFTDAVTTKPKKELIFCATAYSAK